MTEDALLIEIGHNVGMFQATPPDRIAKRAGQRWLEERYEDLRSAVCVPTVHDALDREVFDLCIVVAQAIATRLGDSFGAVTASALLVKQGIRKLCEGT